MSHQTARPDSDDGHARQALIDVRDEIAKVVVGHDAVVSGLVTALLVRGHVLLEGVPGVAKSLLVTTLAAVLDLRSHRIQGTPDLGASDLIGQAWPGEPGHAARFSDGPVFTNLLLADQFNRMAPRTQATLLEAMQERQVTVAGAARALPDPFLVVATQQPLEHEAGRALSEAHLDRFLFRLQVGYPTEAEEREMLARLDRGRTGTLRGPGDVRRVADAGVLDRARQAVAGVPVDDSVQGYVVALARATRETPAVRVGVSPRGTTMLLQAARAWTWLSGGARVTPDEVRAVAKPTLRHRLQVRPEARLDGIGPDEVVDRLLAEVRAPR